MSTDENRLPTSVRMLRIVEELASSGKPISVRELGQRLDLPKPTIYRLCQSMIDEGYLRRDAAEGYVTTTARLRNMANGLLAVGRVDFARHRMLGDIAEKIGETCNLVIPTARGMVYVDRYETQRALRIQLPIGTNVPMHCTASGKLYLSLLTPAKRRRLVSTLPLDRLAPNTLTTVEAIEEELRQTAVRGYGRDNQEFMEGLVALAVPIRDANGHFAAALAFHAPEVRMNLDRAESYLEQLRQGAERIQTEFFATTQSNTYSPADASAHNDNAGTATEFAV